MTAGKTTLNLTGLPSDYEAEYSVDGLDGCTVNGNTLSYSMDAKKGIYTLTIHDKNGKYADLTQKFTLLPMQCQPPTMKKEMLRRL